MILSRSKIIRLYHFTKPILSSLNSLQDLESILQKKLIENIKEVNSSKLKHYQFATQIAQQLKVNPVQAKQISTRTIKLSLIDSKTQRPQTIQVNINQDLKKLKLQSSDFGFPFPQPNITKQHFSQFRGVPTFSQLNQYKLTHKNLLIFNLPDEITEQDIQATLKAKQIKVNFQYCILGLIAYARVQFQSEQSLQECLRRFPQRTLQFGDRIAAIKSLQDKKKLKLGNRRLVVNIDQNRSLQQMTLQFSKYGRVIHIEWPVEAWMNPTLEQVKRHYQNTSQLLKINQIFSDGTIESEYFPALKAWQNLSDERQQQNLIEKAEKLQESYENRCRFARNINIYVGRQHQIITGNKGYCVVTYSTFEQCQNYYFATGSRDKIQVVADKLDFEYDPTFRRQLLRYIDNQFLIGQKKELAQKKQHQKQFSHMIDMAESQKIKSNTQLSYNVAQKIFKKVIYNQSMNRNHQTGFKILRKKNYRDNTLQEWKAYLNKMKAQKAKSKRQSFDELAQIELYGRLLPKDQQKQRLIIQDTTYTPHPYMELINQNQLITDLKSLYRRKKFYRRQIERNNRLADKAHGRVYAEQQDQKDSDVIEQQQKPQVVQQVAATQPIDSGQIGKQPFSTKKPTPLYRKRTPNEYANFKRRFFQFTRNTVFEYMGIFSDKTVEEAANQNIKILNPQSLKWPNGSPFLTEEELPNILQFRRNFEKAQQDYNDYILGSQYLKSSGANLQEIFCNFNQFQAQGLQYLTDVGVVQQARKVAGQNLQQKVNVLNSQISDFGEEYRVQQDDSNNTKYLIKIRKLQHLLPIDRVAHLEKFIQEHGQDVSKTQSEIFHKYYNQMKQKDFIPDQVSEAFGIEKGKRFSDLLAEVGAPHQIFKKDLDMAERAKSYSSDTLKNDLDSQIKLQKIRKKARRVNSNSFVKDPSQIYVKDRQGYYKVSRFRQI